MSQAAIDHPALQLLRIPETRKKILATLGLLAVYRLGFQIPIPGMSPEFLRESSEVNNSLFGILSAFSGGAIGDTTVFALGIMPYISASIIFSVLAKVVPAIEALQKEGATGVKKINQWTRLATVPVALVQSLFVWFGVFKAHPEFLADGAGSGVGQMLAVVCALTAGALLCMWLGELITEYGVGNGASLIIMAGIIATMPAALSQIVGSDPDWWNTVLWLSGIWIGVVGAVVYMQKGERRVPIQYARLQRGRRVYGGQRHFLPLKINMAGVMPIIFASALFIVPGVVFELFDSVYWREVFTRSTGFVYVTLTLVLVFFFSFFWNNLMFQPDEIADNLREHGSFIPGIRPGAKTAEFLRGTLQRITLAGAAFLAVIAVLPNFITEQIPGLTGRLAYFLGGTSVLIVVGVAMDMVDKLNAQLVMRNYEGFMKGAGPGWLRGASDSTGSTGAQGAAGSGAPQNAPGGKG
jgi:preprotein translocase subunit SecY